MIMAVVEITYIDTFGHITVVDQTGKVGGDAGGGRIQGRGGSSQVFLFVRHSLDEKSEQMNEKRNA